MLAAVDIVAKLGNAQPTPRELALCCDFTEEQADLLAVFWDPAFNNGWIYLSDDIIDDQLARKSGGTDKQRKSARNYFYGSVLLAGDYKEGTDYKEIDETHVLVQSSRSPGDQNFRPRGNLLNTRVYYIVTGETYKDLCSRANTTRGREVRAYYRKVEQLAILMRDVILEMVRREAAAKTLLLENELTIARSSALRLNQFARSAEARVASEYIYVATTSHYSKQRHFKVGGTKNIATFRARFSSYMSGRPTTDTFYPAYWQRVHSYKQVENHIEAIAGRYREKDSKEFYVMRFARLCDIVGFAAANDAASMDMHNRLLDGVLTDLAEGEFDASVDPADMPGAEPAADEKEQQIVPENPLRNFIVANSATIADPAHQPELGGQVLSLLIEGFDFAQEKDNTHMFVWKTLADTLKAAEKNAKVLQLGKWKSAIKKTITGTSITFKWR